MVTIPTRITFCIAKWVPPPPGGGGGGGYLPWNWVRVFHWRFSETWERAHDFATSYPVFRRKCANWWPISIPESLKFVKIGDFQPINKPKLLKFGENIRICYLGMYQNCWKPNSHRRHIPVLTVQRITPPPPPPRLWAWYNSLTVSDHCMSHSIVISWS